MFRKFSSKFICKISHDLLTMRLRSVICLLTAVSGVSSLFAESLSHVEDQATEALRRGKYDEAIGLYTKLISHYPKSAAAYYDRGVCYLEKYSCDRAIADFSEAIRLEPSNLKYHCKLATAYAEKGF